MMAKYLQYSLQGLVFCEIIIRQSYFRLNGLCKKLCDITQFKKLNFLTLMTKKNMTLSKHQYGFFDNIYNNTASSYSGSSCHSKVSLIRFTVKQCRSCHSGYQSLSLKKLSIQKGIQTIWGKLTVI